MVPAPLLPFGLRPHRGHDRHGRSKQATTAANKPERSGNKIIKKASLAAAMARMRRPHAKRTSHRRSQQTRTVGKQQQQKREPGCGHKTNAATGEANKPQAKPTNPNEWERINSRTQAGRSHKRSEQAQSMRNPSTKSAQPCRTHEGNCFMCHGCCRPSACIVVILCTYILIRS